MSSDEHLVSVPYSSISFLRLTETSPELPPPEPFLFPRPVLELCSLFSVPTEVLELRPVEEGAEELKPETVEPCRARRSSIKEICSELIKPDTVVTKVYQVYFRSKHSYLN